MARGRKPMNRELVTVPPLPVPARQTGVVLEPVERSDEQVLADRFEQLQQSYSADRDLFNTVIGRIEMANAFEQISARVRSGELAVIKENKLFRCLRGRKTPHGAEFLGTWEEFCERILGRSVDQVDRDIANVRAFGEQALDAMERAGLGYRQLRDLRRLPAEDREAVIQVAETEDKEALLDVVERLVARKVQAQAEAEAAGQALKDAKEVHRRLMADKTQRNEQLLEANEKLVLQLQRREQLERSNPDERMRQLTGELTAMAYKIAFDIRNNLARGIEQVREAAERDGVAVDDPVAAALGIVRRALGDTEEDLGVSLSVRYPAWSYPDKEGRTPEAGPELGQVYGESDHERVEREFAETAAFAAAYDPKDTYRQTIAWMRAQGHSEEEIRATHAWHELYGAAAAPADAGSAVLDSAAAASLDSAVAPSLDSAVAPSRLRVVGGGRLPAPELLPAPMLGQAGRQAGGE